MYVAVPYLCSIHYKLKSILNDLYLCNVKMAPKNLISTQFNFYSNLKDERDLANIKNASFKIECEDEDCNFEFFTVTESLDVERTFLHLTRNETSSLGTEPNAFFAYIRISSVKLSLKIK